MKYKRLLSVAKTLYKNPRMRKIMGKYWLSELERIKKKPKLYNSL
jgi:hypothetical protein